MTQATFGLRVREERESRDWTQQRLADEASNHSPSRRLTQDDIAKIENRRAERSKHAPAIAAALGLRLDWALAGSGPKYLHASGVPDELPPAVVTAADERDWTDVRGYAVAVGLGAAPEADEYAEAHKLKFRVDSLKRKGLYARRLAVWTCVGDSMLPDIREGDTVMFDESDTTVKDGELYVIRVGAKEHQLKKALILDGAVYFCATNPDGDHAWRKPRRMDDRRNPIHVVGRAWWIGRWLA